MLTQAEQVAINAHADVYLSPKPEILNPEPLTTGQVLTQADQLAINAYADTFNLHAPNLKPETSKPETYNVS